MKSPRRLDWFQFILQFVIGALVGAALGFKYWAKSPHADSASVGIFYLGGAALVCGVLSGFIGDSFWKDMIDWLLWW